MQAVILAAGLGKRLGELTKNNTKCMVKVNGVTLIDRLLTQLSSLNLTKIIIVIGYKGDILRSYIGENYKGMPIQYINNPIYDKTNNIYSLSLVKSQLQEDDTLLIESDLIFEDSIFTKIIENKDKNVALVAKYEPWMDGTMVCIDDDYKIINFIPQKAFSYNEISHYYKTVNIYKFSKDFSKNQYIPFLEAYTKALGNNEYYEQVLRVITLLDQCDLKALPLSGEKWYEIDDIQDLDIAEAIFSQDKDKLHKIQSRYGGYWRFPSIIDYCYLVNPYFPPAKMKEEIKANFNELLTQYPSGMSVNSLLAAKYFGVKQEYICIGNGAAELIKSLLSQLTGNIGIILPTFEEYPNRAHDGINIITYTPNNANFSYSSKDIITAFNNKNLRALLLINPDNPSGNLIDKSGIESLLEWSRQENIQLIVDESFLDFSDDCENITLLKNDILATYPNLIIIKSISKSYGVPGLRLGIMASSNVELINWIKKDVSIWNINSFAEFYLQIFGKYTNDYQKGCFKFKEERARMFKELSTISFMRTIPSQANYFLCEIIRKYTATELTETLLNKYQILIKDCSKKQAFQKGNYIRIAIRNMNDNNKLIKAMQDLDNLKL